MNWLWMNVPLMVVFFAAMTGIPLWLSLRHPDTGPETLATESLAGVVTPGPLLKSEVALAR